ncbi:hypothetical protein [Singulisphaera sp. PoT]|uniref:hypothetical protein n=1 Tax=Singulisphaera sp. PoT TaxID=3411797 RepID=UPI003BF5F59A
MIFYPVYAVLMAALLVSLSRTISLTRSLLARERCCPHCRNSLSLKREHRTAFDHVVGRFVESRRYKCLVCRWSALFRYQPGEATRSTEFDLVTGVDAPRA